MKDLYSNIDVISNLVPYVGTNSDVQTAVEADLAGANSAVVCIFVGEEGSSLSGSNYFKWTMTHADDDGTGASDSYTNVTTADCQGVTVSSGVILTVDAAAEDSLMYKFGYIGGKRFLKIAPSEVGTAPDLPQAVFIIKGNLLDAPPIA